jgi:hypothetical protein
MVRYPTGGEISALQYFQTGCSGIAALLSNGYMGGGGLWKREANHLPQFSVEI